MDFLKSIYISLFATYCTSVGVWALYMQRGGLDWGWTGAALATLPVALGLGAAYLTRRVARTPRHLHVFLVASLAGTGLATWHAFGGHAPGDATQRLLPLALAAGGLLLYLGYDLWYSKLPTRSSRIEVGALLPAFRVQTPEGAPQSSEALAGSPALLLFFRGNWCPLCMAQIEEVARMYRELSERGVKLWLISPQPPGHSARLAERFDAPMDFYVDPGSEAAKALGIAHASGVPAGLQVLGYDGETVLPTVVITDREGKVVWKDETDNYRVRPEPETFLRVLEAHGLA